VKWWPLATQKIYEIGIPTTKKGSIAYTFHLCKVVASSHLKKNEIGNMVARKGLPTKNIKPETPAARKSVLPENTLTFEEEHTFTFKEMYTLTFRELHTLASSDTCGHFAVTASTIGK